MPSHHAAIALGCALAIAACGDTAARPLYLPPQGTLPEAAPLDSENDGALRDAGTLDLFDGGVAQDMGRAELDVGISQDVGTLDAGVPRPCSTDQPLSIMTSTSPNVGRPGALYAGPPLDPYVPRPIAVRLTTTAGAPVPGCDVTWTPATGSGWVFPNARATDSEGRVDAWWTAGESAMQSVTASVTDDKGGVTRVPIAGTVQARRTNPTRVYLQYPVDAYDGFNVEVVPQSAPADSSFAAIWTSQCGAGLDNVSANDGGQPSRAFAFCWNANAEPTAVVDRAMSSCTAITSTNGQSGTFCSLNFAWQTGSAYRFELATRQPVAGHTDYAFYVTSIKTAERIKVTEFRYASGRLPNAASSYLQNDAPAASCLQTGQTAGLFREVHQIEADIASAVGSATFARDYDVDRDVICANYSYGTSGRAFSLSTGGMEVGTPRPPGWPAPVIVLP